eukprot:g2265.t1
MASQLLYVESTLGKGLSAALERAKEEDGVSDALARWTMLKLNNSIERKLFNAAGGKGSGGTAAITGQMSAFNICEELAQFYVDEAQFRSAGAAPVRAEKVRILAIQADEDDGGEAAAGGGGGRRKGRGGARKGRR